MLVEKNQAIKNNGECDQKHKLFTFIGVLFALELISFFIAGYSLTENEWGGLGAGVVQIFITIPLSVISVILSIVGIVKYQKNKKFICYLILIISPIIAIPDSPLMSKTFFSGIYSPIRGAQWDREFKKNQETKNSHYDFFVNEFLQEKTVKSVSCGSVITFDDGVSVTLSGPTFKLTDYYSPDEYEKIHSQIEIKMRDKLVGKKVKVIMPTKEDFLYKYLPGGVGGCYLREYDSSWPKPFGEKLGELEVDGTINGEKIDRTWLGIISN
jgi:hypothetical protein